VSSYHATATIDVWYSDDSSSSESSYEHCEPSYEHCEPRYEHCEPHYDSYDHCHSFWH
jgi:hypothetical protein